MPIKHTISVTAPTAASVGDEWVNPTVPNLLYKKTLLNGAVGWTPVPLYSVAGDGTSITILGDFTASGNITAFSDERLKQDWTKLPNNFVDQLSKVKSGTYTRIDTNTRQAGSSAQDWQALLPEVVLISEDDTLSLAYGNAALVSAIELAKKVVELEAKIAKLEKLVSQLIEV